MGEVQRLFQVKLYSPVRMDREEKTEGREVLGWRRGDGEGRGGRKISISQNQIEEKDRKKKDL